MIKIERTKEEFHRKELTIGIEFKGTPEEIQNLRKALKVAAFESINTNSLALCDLAIALNGLIKNQGWRKDT